MYESELELEAELEDLISDLSASNLESEAEQFGPAPSTGTSPSRIYRDQWVIGYHLAQGMFDENHLTDAVFFDRHPERNGRLLTSGESALVREWVEIRDLIVRPMLGHQQTSQQRVPSHSGSSTPSWVPRVLPALNQYRGNISPLPNRYPGEIPLYVLLGWINVESVGRLEGPTIIGELGYFQLHPEESQSLQLDHPRLRTDADYSIWGGIQLVRWKADGAQKRGFPPGTELFWRVAKWLHWLPGVVDLFLKDMRAAGVDPNTGWNVIEQYVNTNQNRLDALTRATYRIKALGSWQAMVGINNVNKTIQSGQQLAAGLGSP